MWIGVFSISSQVSSHVPLGEAGLAKSLLLKCLEEIPRGSNLVGSQSGHLLFPLDTSKENGYFESTCYETTQSIFYVTRLLCELHNTKTAYCYSYINCELHQLLADCYTTRFQSIRFLCD